MLKIGIVGLPNVGKSTLFKALTKKQVEIANYPFTTINPNIGVVAMPDVRLEKITNLIKPEEYFPAVVEFVDIAGLIKGAHKGEGLGNQFLSHIYNVDAILFLIRHFKDKDISSTVSGPEEEIKILKEELIKKDEEIIQQESKLRPVKKFQQQSKPEKFETLRLSEKPSIIVCNIKSAGENYDPPTGGCELTLDAKLEQEMSEMTIQELKDFELTPLLPQLIKKAYETLNLITFYTIKGGKEIRAWPIKKESKTPEAGGIVHTDFQEKFIRAEVIQWDKLIEAGNWYHAREKGWLRTEGHNYAVQDGDVIEFKI
jgi:small GTP-binding protein